jgi:hypothetical protein
VSSFHAAGISGVALLSLRSALRSWLVRIGALAVIVVPFLLAAFVTGDDTPVGRVRAYASLSISFVSFLLALVAVFLPAQIARDLARGRLTQAVVGPLPRSLIVGAWWLGAVAVLSALVALGYGAVGAGMQVVHSQLETQLAQLPENLQAEARREVEVALKARTVAPSEMPDEEIYVRYAQERFQRIVLEGRLPEGVSPEEAIQRLYDSAEVRGRSIPRGRRRGWTVKGVTAAAGAETVTLRFRFAARGTGAGDPNARVPLLITVGNRSKRGAWTPLVRHEIQVPGAALAGQDEVLIGVQNLSREEIVVLFPREGPALLFPAGGLASNLARAMWIEVCRLGFLAAVGVAAAVILDAKLAALVVLFVLALGYGQSFLSDSLKPGLFGFLDGPVLALLRAVLWALPDLGRAEVSVLVANGEEIGSGALRAGLMDLTLRGALALGLGAWVFRGRELGTIR